MPRLIKELSIEKIEAVLEAKGYEIFHGKNDMNMIGIRIKGDENVDRYRHVILFIWDTEENNHDSRIMVMFPVTTDPGKFYLENPINEKGTALLAEGQWKGLFKKGSHRGRPALVQASPCGVHRDNNRDGYPDYGDVTDLDYGWFAINAHDRLSHGDLIGNASAGCQVYEYTLDINYCLGLLDRQIESNKGSTLTYTLLSSDDFKESTKKIIRKILGLITNKGE